MNIFEFEGKEFDKKLDELFKNVDKEQLKKELIECGLVLNQNITLKCEYNQQMTYNIKEDYSTFDIHRKSTSNGIFANILSNIGIKNKKEIEEVA